MFSGIASPFLRGQTPPDDPSQILIVIEKKAGYNPSTGPKSPYVVHLHAYYDCTTSEIVVSAQNAGTSISVCVENLVSGVSSQHTIRHYCWLGVGQSSRAERKKTSNIATVFHYFAST